MNQKKIVRSFLITWNRSQIVFLGIILIIGSLMTIFFVDQPLTRWFHDSFHREFDFIARIITWFGYGDTYFLISTLGYLMARFVSNRNSTSKWVLGLQGLRVYFGFMFFCFLISGLLVLMLKALFGRARPYMSLEYHPFNFQPLTLNWDFQSYPSGHTQVGFTLASFLSILYPRHTSYFFVFASLVGLSRVALEKHYLGDVFAGAYVGVLGTYIAWHWKGKKWLSQRER